MRHRRTDTRFNGIIFGFKFNLLHFQRSTESMKEKQIAKVPLAFLEVLIAWWIFTALVATMRTLSIRQNHVKLALYRQLTNVLALSLGVAVLFMLWSLYIHVFQRCMTDWKELWVDTAFWHLFFVAILVMIMILWRPSQNNQVCFCLQVCN